ncbi:unnamed protein product [Rotaria sp. Silwood1]|nr:unnamed protein product [Rotaria sp. Silwood1]
MFLSTSNPYVNLLQQENMFLKVDTWKSLILIHVLFNASANAQSSCDRVSFVDRKGWNARDPTSITNLTGKPLSFYVIHHTYQPPNCYDDDECIQRVQAIQDLHQNSQEWVDIGYHFLVGENGKVYEGRGWNRQAAHSPGWNNDAYDVSSSKMTYDLNEKNPLFLLQPVFDDDSPTLYIYLFLILIFSFQSICIIDDFKTSSPNEKALEATRLWIDCGIERVHVTEAYYIITHRQL